MRATRPSQNCNAAWNLVWKFTKSVKEALCTSSQNSDSQFTAEIASLFRCSSICEALESSPEEYRRITQIFLTKSQVQTPEMRSSKR